MYNHRIECSPFVSAPVTGRYRDLFRNQVSSDALAAYVLEALYRHRSMSVVRMGDGEAQIMDRYLTGRFDGECSAPEWLEKMGLTGADIYDIGKQLHRCAASATYLGLTSWGAYRPGFDVLSRFRCPPRSRSYCSAFFGLEWYASGHVIPLLRSTPFSVLHPDPESICRRLRDHLGVDGMPVECRDHTGLSRAFSEAEDSGRRLHICASGPAGKPKIAEYGSRGGVWLDVGHALERCWARSRKNN